MTHLIERKLPAKIEYLQEVIDLLSDVAISKGIASEKVIKMQVVLEEVFVNICKYSYNNGNNAGVLIRVWVDSNYIYVEFIDWGKPFNILDSEDPDISLDIADREVGGLGIWLVKNLSDEITYSRDRDKNTLRLAFGF
ncbi:MAG: ATP-binding protein [Thermodesulfovibrionales bacterium]